MVGEATTLTVCGLNITGEEDRVTPTAGLDCGLTLGFFFAFPFCFVCFVLEVVVVARSFPSLSTKETICTGTLTVVLSIG